MARTLDTATLDLAATTWAGHLNLPDVFSKKNSDVAIGGREWVMQSLFNAHFKDEFDYLMAKMVGKMGPDVLAEFEAEAAERFTPRSDEMLAELLAEKLAITPEGDHIPGNIGTVVVGSTQVGTRVTRHGMKNAVWREYAGEKEERAAGNVRVAGQEGPGADPFPPEGTIFPDETAHMGYGLMFMALNTNVSIEFAQAGVDAALDLLDEGTVDGVIEGRTGAQPVDPNAAVTGTLLFSLDLGTPGFGAATDAAPGALATAAAIADDISADATATLSYCRASSANVLITPLNDHIDGEAGTSGADFIFNTLAIVSGATVSMTAWTVTQPQGPTAT